MCVCVMPPQLSDVPQPSGLVVVTRGPGDETIDVLVDAVRLVAQQLADKAVALDAVSRESAALGEQSH